MKPLDINDLRFKFRKEIYSIVPISQFKMLVLEEDSTKYHKEINATTVSVRVIFFVPKKGWYFQNIVTGIECLLDLASEEFDHKESAEVYRGGLAYKAVDQYMIYFFKNKLYKNLD